MRQKEEKLIITFPTTAAAMAMELRARELGVPGRLIPTPAVITASCGLAWMAAVRERERVEDMLREQQLKFKDSLILTI